MRHSQIRSILIEKIQIDRLCIFLRGENGGVENKNSRGKIRLDLPNLPFRGRRDDLGRRKVVTWRWRQSRGKDHVHRASGGKFIFNFWMRSVSSVFCKGGNETQPQLICMTELFAMFGDWFGMLIRFFLDLATMELRFLNFLGFFVRLNF